MIATDDNKRRFLQAARRRFEEAKQQRPAFLKNRYRVQLEKPGYDGVAPLSIKAGLEPYTETLDRARAAHVLRRLGFGAPVDQVNALVGRPAGEVIDQLIDDALDTDTYPLPSEPSWANTPIDFTMTEEEFQEFIELNIGWVYELQNEWFQTMRVRGLRERMTLFWHNHFVTQVDDYFVAMHAYRYLNLLRTHALGNFKDHVRLMGTDPAMLEYLDGNSNRNVEPNENYARELLELFTMSPKDKDGNDNYTQEDITEIARALTGWVIDYINHQAVFFSNRFDDGDKTFLGRTGAFGYNDVIDIIFEERGAQTAYYVCYKLYREFIYAVPDPAIVAELANTFIEQDFEVAPVIRQLLKSAHFFDAQAIGAHIKSPIELIAGMPNEIGRDLGNFQLDVLRVASFLLEQNLLDPPNVAGWPGYRSWISTTSLPIRWLVTDFLLFGDGGANLVDLVPVVSQFAEASDPLAAFKLPVAIAEYFMAVPIESLDIGNVTEEFGGDLVNFPIPEEVLNGPTYVVNLAKIFLVGVPWYEWSLEHEQAPLLLALFARFLTQLPEFHLG